MNLHVADDLSFPARAVTETFGILAVRGAGKSNTAAVMAEEMFKAKLPFVVVDPVRAWYGLRASADGKGPGLPIPIFGGRRGDVPLERGAGNLMADLVVDQRLSCVLDLSDFDSEGSKKQFLLDFGRRLYQRNEQPLHLFLEEADDYIPQRPMRDEAQLLRAWENIVRRGRNRGLGITLITQRSASLSKMVLTQVQTLIAMRTTGPQDIAAIREWVKYHQQSEKILASLASLEDGEAWVWSPQFLNKTVRVRFRRRETFDSGATPKMGEGAKAPATLADIDLTAVKARMAATIERARAEDPKELRRELAAAKAEIARLGAAKPAPVTTERVEVPALKGAEIKRLESLAARVEGALTRLGGIRTNLDEDVAALRGVASEILATVRMKLTPVPAPVIPVRREQSTHARIGKVGGPTGSGKVMVSRDAGESLPKAERAILTVLAQHQDGCEAGRLALLAGYRWSGGFRNSLSALRTAGLMVGENSAAMRITDQGFAALGDYDPLPTGQALIDYWLRHPSLGKCERAILEVLVAAHPKGLRADELVTRTGYEWSGGFRNALSAIRTAGLVIGKNSAEMRAIDTLF